MPVGIALDEDGFEDPAEFMRSPTNTLRGSPSRRTTIGDISVAPSSVGQARRKSRGRMSRMDGSDDDDDDMVAAGLGADDDDDGESRSSKDECVHMG